MEVIGHDHKCMQQEHRPAAEPCDQMEGVRDVRLWSRSGKTYGLIAELGAFSPGLKPGHGRIKRSRGFENPLPRTESPGLAQGTMRHSQALKMYKLQAQYVSAGDEGYKLPSPHGDDTNVSSVCRPLRGLVSAPVYPALTCRSQIVPSLRH